MASFHTVIRKARFFVPGYSPEQMQRLATVLNNDIKSRLDRGMDVTDSPAPSLSTGYARFKERKYGRNLRDWNLTGQTRGHMKVLVATHNKATLGFLDGFRLGRAPLSISAVVAILQRRRRQYGASPTNMAVVRRARQIMDSPVKAQAA